MRKPELLAPAGNMESLYAAVSAGCDAVYLGGYTFGARSFAGNFSLEEMKEVVCYCHLYGVKVYVTVNTVIYESEIEMLMDYVDQLVSLHVDALIIQDLGALDLIHQTYPELELHASTQMHIHNVEGVKLALKLGCKRVVLARETSIETIQKVKTMTSAEVEIFVHGALCVSYSGQCLMSSLIGGRSGNRGSCAGSCRQKYRLVKKENGSEKVIKENAYLLSMKDLNTLEHIGTLIDLGIESFKIEGRMKSPSYVYLVTSLYRYAIDTYLKTGSIKINQSLLQKLEYVFHRRFTKGFMFHEENEHVTNSFRPNHLGVEIGTVIDVKNDHVFIKLTKPVKIKDGIRILGKEDTGCFLNDFYRQGKLVKEAYPNDTISFKIKGTVEKQSKVVKTYDEIIMKEIELEIQNNKRKIPIDMNVSIACGKPMILTVIEKEHQVTVESEYRLESPKKNGTMKERMIEQLSKLGGTVYEVRKINIDQTSDVFVPISILNDLRRRAIEKLNELRLKRPELKKETYIPHDVDVCQTNETELVVSLTQYRQLKDKEIKVYVDNDEKETGTNLKNIVWRLPNVMDVYPEIQGRVLVEELGSISCYDDFEAGIGFNVCNSYTVHLLHALGAKEVTLSYECDFHQIDELMTGYKNRYHHLPNVSVVMRSIPKMMTTKYKLLSFDTKDERYALQDRFGNLYPLCIKNNLMYLYYDRVITPFQKEEITSLGVTNLRYEFLPFEEQKLISNIQK